ncbi:MAG: carboxypeptidase-like regulatory domain-containing protein [Gemmataceae bacterium]
MLAQLRHWFAPVRKPIRSRLGIEILEGRDVPSVVSAITADFNGTKIPAGDALWFSGAIAVSGLPKAAQATLHVENGVIDFTASGVPYHVAVPNGVILFTPGANSASTSFDPTDSDWDVSVPTGGTGDVFMSGVRLALPNGLPGGIKNVTWTADFWSDTPNLTVNWKWAAAAYKPGISTDYNALNVKPVDNKDLSAYHNGDQSGTPEAFKSLVVGGGTGGGGTNFTGNFTPAVKVKPTVGDGMSDYPYPSSNPLTNVAFNESAVLRAANLDLVGGAFQVWYNDEHALALGVSQVNVKTSSGTVTTNYPIASMTSNPASALNPAIGTTATTGDQAGTDLSGRPMAPSLYITDITTNPNDRSGDWQFGGTAYAPSAVFGSWKPFIRTVDYTTSTPTITVTPPVDPVKNNWILGAGSDPAPAGLTNEGYGAEIRWSLSDLQTQKLLVPGHTYRFYVIVHDGDQNKVGGDAGQASFTYYYPGVISQTASIGGVVAESASPHAPIPNVQVTLTGIDNQGNPVSMTTTTDANGVYLFTEVPSGTYTITQCPPEQLADMRSLVSETGVVGTMNGAGTGSGTASGFTITDIYLAPGDSGTDYDFFDSYKFA